jgi:chemotaxis protein MotB
MMKTKLIIPALLLIMQACVPARLLEEAKSGRQSCEEDLKKARTEGNELLEKNKELEDSQRLAQKKIKELEQDTTLQGKHISMINRNFEKLNETYNLLIDKNNRVEEESVRENSRLSGDLKLTQDRLQKKEDNLRQLETTLNTRESALRKAETELSASRLESEERAKQLKEMNRILTQKDSVVNSVRKKVSDALLQFENNGLTVSIKNGKVYVSLEERLLFASGSTQVDSKGEDALKKLANVLEQNTDINVTVEGHTDNVPYNSSGGAIKDNWDLSVLRATAIVRILLSNSKIDAKRLMPAGHGEFMPVAKEATAEARRKNRRTEIILTPKLDELFKIIESN